MAKSSDERMDGPAYWESALSVKQKMLVSRLSICGPDIVQLIVQRLNIGQQEAGQQLMVCFLLEFASPGFSCRPLCFFLFSLFCGGQTALGCTLENLLWSGGAVRTNKQVFLCRVVQKCVSVVEDDGVKEANNTTEVKWSCGAAMTAPGLTSVGFPTMESENMGHFGVVLFY